MAEQQTQPFAGWAILELMGHQRAVGYVTEVSLFGAAMARVDVPAFGEHKAETRWYSAASIYGVSLTTEEAVRTELEQVARWEAPRPTRLLGHPVIPIITEEDEDGAQGMEEDDQSPAQSSWAMEAADL